MNWEKEQHGYEIPESCECGYGENYTEGYETGYETGYNKEPMHGQCHHDSDEVIPAYSYTYRVPACKEYRKTIFVKKCRKVCTYYKPAGSCVTPGRCYEVGKGYHGGGNCC